jgi:hypothetical protein
MADDTMYVLVLTLLTYEPKSSPPVVTGTEMLKIEGYSTQQACETAALPFNNYRLPVDFRGLNVGFKGICVLE